MHWSEVPGWFKWRSAQEEAVAHFPEHSRFVEVGTYLGRSICSLAEVVQQSGKEFTIIGIDTCQGSGPEGPQKKNYHGSVVNQYGGTFAGALHKNILDCGFANLITLMITDSETASRLFANASLDWVHLDARHDYISLKADIQAWLPKVRRGGWMSGDDYDQEKWPEVIQTIQEVLPEALPWSTLQWRRVIP
jgi:hypothetical protein